MIRACMITYNDASTIQMALESVQPHVDEIVAVDGAFATFPGAYDDPWSSDGTLDILDKYGVKIIGQGIYPNQIVKRQTYFDYCRPSDWAFIIDGDEVLKYGENLQNLNPDISYYYGITCITLCLHQDDFNIQVRYRPRAFYMREKLRYMNRHFTILNTKGQDIMAWPNFMAYPWIAAIMHMNIFRSQMRRENKKYWYTGGALRRLERNTGAVGKPLHVMMERQAGHFGKTLNFMECLKLCKQNDYDKFCVNNENDFCHAYKQPIPTFEYETVQKENLHPYEPDVLWRIKNEA